MVAKSLAQRILSEVRAIPRGEVAGYGDIAARAGLPGRARLTARVLSENTDPALPWHRVLRADGRIAFPLDSSSYHEQCQRLRCEGLAVIAGRVRAASAVTSIDEQFWGPAKRGAPAA